MTMYGMVESVHGLGLWISAAEHLGLEYDEMVNFQASAEASADRVKTVQNGCAVYYRRKVKTGPMSVPIVPLEYRQ